MKTIFQQLNSHKRCTRRKRLSVSEMLLAATQLVKARKLNTIDVFLTASDRHDCMKAIAQKEQKETRGRLRPSFSWEKSKFGFDALFWRMQSLTICLISSRELITPGLIQLSDTPSIYHSKRDGSFKVKNFKRHRVFYGVESFIPE